MKNVDDMLPSEGMNVGEVLEAVGNAVSVILVTSLPSRETAAQAVIYLSECVLRAIRELEKAGEANWSVKDKGGLQ